MQKIEDKESDSNMSLSDKEGDAADGDVAKSDDQEEIYHGLKNMNDKNLRRKSVQISHTKYF